MEKEKIKTFNIKNIIVIMVLLIFIYFAYNYYQQNNFNNFIRSEANLHTSEFKRDSDIKYSKYKSYKIISEEYNDAMFYKAVKVEKNQSYKVSCMVKTENVVAKEENSGIGAQISIEGTTERSVAVNRNIRLAKNRIDI